MVTLLMRKRSELLNASLMMICVSVLLGLLIPNTRGGLLSFALIWIVLFVLYSVVTKWRSRTQRLFWIWLIEYCALLVVGIVVYGVTSLLRGGTLK